MLSSGSLVLEDWRKKTDAIHGLGGNGCLNCKQVYEELKYGTPLEQCLVDMLEYFKHKSTGEATYMLQDDGSFRIHTDIDQALNMPNSLCQVIPVVASSPNDKLENDVLDSPEKDNITDDMPSPVIAPDVEYSPSVISEREEIVLESLQNDDEMVMVSPEKW